MITYRGYIGHFFFDENTKLFVGKVANIHELITFQGKSVKETKEAFRDSVNEYINWCKKHGKVPIKYSTIE